MNTEEGMRIYLRTLLCVLISTTEKLYPGTKLEVRSTLGSALYIADKREPLRNIDDGILELAYSDLMKAYRVLKWDVKKYLEENNERFVETCL